MNKGNKILSTVLIAASIGLLFGLLFLREQMSGIRLLNLPSYHNTGNLTPAFLLVGIAAVFGMFGGLFAWLKVKMDGSEGKEKARLITEDVTRGLKKKEVYFAGTPKQDDDRTELVNDKDETEAVADETVAAMEKEGE